MLVSVSAILCLRVASALRSSDLGLPTTHPRTFATLGEHPLVAAEHQDAAALGFDPSLFDHSTVLRADPPLYAYWRLEGDLLAVGVDVHGHAEDAWVGLGVSGNSGMLGADVWLLRRGTGQEGADSWVLEDAFSHAQERPQPDAHQDVTLLSVVQGEARISYSFSRSLAPCDGGAQEDLAQGDLDIVVGRAFQTLIWAVGVAEEVTYHGFSAAQRGMEERHAWAPEQIQFPEVNTTGATVLELVNNAYTIPATTTTYAQTYWEIPPGDWVIVDIARRRGDGVLKYIHHTLLYGCTDTPEPSSDPGLDKRGSCSEILIVASQYLPEGAKGGIVVGEAASIKSLRIEVHYDNLDVEQGILDDGTGYVVSLMPNDGEFTEVGTITTGTINLNLPEGAPKGSEETHAWGTCTIPEEVGEEGITVLFNAWHMHLAGRSMWAQVVRDGEEIAELGRQNFYDWNFQMARGAVEEGTKLYPGDTLITHCLFDTVGYSQTTTYGQETSDEMCFDFIMYFPRNPVLNRCFGISGMGKLPKPEDLDADDFTEYGAGDIVASDDLCPSTSRLFTSCERASGCYQYGCQANGELRTTGAFEACGAASACSACYPQSPCGGLPASLDFLELVPEPRTCPLPAEEELVNVFTRMADGSYVPDAEYSGARGSPSSGAAAALAALAVLASLRIL